METFAFVQQGVEQTAQNFQGTVRALVLVGIAIFTFILVILIGVRQRSWVPAFGVLLIGAAMYWAVSSWDVVRDQVSQTITEDTGGGGSGGGGSSRRSTGG
jgi:glucan phosphoethanolaminetransferase (alkaline phosphatase superfamily)